MKLSIVIPTKNDAQNGQLTAVIREMAHLPIERLVVDWGSTVPVVVPEGVRCIRVPPEIAARKDQDSYFAFVIAFNAGLRRANGEYVAYIGNDTFCDEALLTWLETADPKTFYVISRRNIVSLETKATFEPSRISTNYGAGGAFLAHRDVWAALRGFDEKYIYYGWTDRETAERAKLLGFRVRKTYDAFVYHIRHPKSKMRAAGRINERVFPKEGLLPTTAVVNGEEWGLAHEVLA